MSDERVWDEEARAELRETIESQILGRIRLAKSDHDEILETCCEVYIGDECPEEEFDTFAEFAEETLRRTATKHAQEMSAWPRETDCDRLDRVEAKLLEEGILLWQASPCCDSCTFGELADRMDEIDERHPGFRARVRGYSFFIDQNLPEELAEGTETSVYLAYGWLSPDGEEVAPEVGEQRSLAIAGEVRRALEAEGFDVDWDGSFSRKMHLSLNWQRRTPLV